MEAGSDLVLRAADDGTGVRPASAAADWPTWPNAPSGWAGRCRPADEDAGTGTVMEWRVRLQQPSRPAQP
jgi:hypothetical protein